MSTRQLSTAVAMAFALALASPAPVQGQGHNPKAGDPIPGQYIVILKDKAMPEGISAKRANEKALAVLKKNQGKKEDLGKVFKRSVKGFTAKLSPGQVKKLAEDPEVAYLEPDRVITLAPPPGKGKGRDKKKEKDEEEEDGNDGSQQVPWGIGRVGGAQSGTGKTAWVIDTGVDLDHPDLQVDTTRSETFIDSGADSQSADDGNGHGTHVAGTIAARDNGIGVVGVAHGATIVAIKVLNSSGSGTYSGVIAGVDHVATHAAPGDVANMSLGGPASQALDDAVAAAAAKGVIFALAAGNSATDANSASPARLEAANVFTVSAIDDGDNFASFSNFSGPTNPPVEFAAPGVEILSTWKDGGYNTISGTSMAAPHVAGLLLLHGSGLGSDGNVKAGDPDGDPDPIAHQ